MGVTIFTADIIYHLFDQFTAYLKRVSGEHDLGRWQQQQPVGGGWRSPHVGNRYLSAPVARFWSWGAHTDSPGSL